MLTRIHIRRSLTWVCLGLGGLRLVGYVLSFLGPISRDWGTDRRVEAGRGAFVLNWVAVDPVGWMAALPVQGDQGTRWWWLPRWSESPHPFNNATRVGRFILPYWILVAIGAAAAYRLLPPGYPRGRCGKCGYDVSGVPVVEGVLKCPECGGEIGGRG